MVGVTHSTPVPARFHHREQAGCDCPIHRGQPEFRDPFTAPLGYRFADDIHVEEISRERAQDVYAAHHSYMTSLPDINLAHHGLYYQDSLVGAITYRYPLLSKKAIHLDADGTVVPAPIDIDDELPRELRATARRVITETSSSDVDDRRVEQGDAFVEAARICLGVRMPNLASASLARSMDRFVDDHARDRDVEYLLTFIRADYDGAMVRALRDKGWRCIGYSAPSESGNRDGKAIREAYKWQFLCDLQPDGDQTTFARWSA